MIFVDASAIVAIMTREASADDLLRRLEADPRRTTSAVAIYEATLAIVRKRVLGLAKARELVTRFLTEIEIDCLDIGEREGALAIEAHGRFGKGRHPARLNLGDCFSYACARAHGASLLFEGSDFPQTDIGSA